MSHAGPGGNAGEGGDRSESQIAKMILFIEQEAEEKVREIRMKAQGEAIKEQGRMMLEETQKINEAHKRRLKQVEVSHKIKHTGKINEYRLKLYKQREELLQDLFSKVEEKIKVIVSDEGRYPDIMKNLMLQAMYWMICSKIIVSCRKSDEPLVKKLMPEARKVYEDTTGMKSELVLNTQSFIPDSALGGIVMSSPDGAIKINNTLREKFTVLYSKIPPNLSKELFGSFSVDDVPTFEVNV